MGTVLVVAGCALAGTVVGGVVGAWAGADADRGSDFPMAAGLYGIVGAGIGCFCGALAGAAVAG